MVCGTVRVERSRKPVKIAIRQSIRRYHDPLCYTAADEAESPTGGGADRVVADDGQLLPAAVPLQPISMM